jgi:hypothetical protein
MSISNFIPQIWSTKILRTLEDNLVGKRICTLDAEGEIKKFGDTVIFNGLADPTISSYSGASISYEALQDASVVLQISQQDYFAFKVGDIEKAQANVDVKGSQADRAAYKLQQTADSYILGLYGQAGLTSSGTITSANIFSKVGEVQQSLAQNNVSDSDMWMVIPPWIRLKLELAGVKFQVNNGTNGTGGMAWTDSLGFDIYVTNQVANTGTLATPVSKVLAGSYNSIAFASQIMETEAIRLESTFDTGVRGLHVYGAKVIQPNLLHTATFTYSAETTI